MSVDTLRKHYIYALIDPLSLKVRYVGQGVSAQRRRCDDCDRVPSPGNLGRHLKHSGHSGYTIITEET